MNQAIFTQLKTTIAWLRQFSRLPILGGWQRDYAYRRNDQSDWSDQSDRGNAPNNQSSNTSATDLKACELDPERQIILFDRGASNIQLRQTWRLPNRIHGLPTQGATVRLYLLWWAAEIVASIDGKQAQEGDLFDQRCRLLVAKNTQPEQEFKFELRLTAPSHDRGALHASTIQLEYPAQPCDPGKFADELAVIAAYLTMIEKRSPDLLPLVTKAVEQLAKLAQQPVNHELCNQLAKIRQSLLPLSPFLKQRKIHLVGNAHIDVAWLWPIAETKDVTRRTFASVLKLQQTYPELIFNQTTALSYQWIEQAEPELFTQIQAAVAQGKWEPIGGMWVESDCNLPGGESLIRQILYGKQYFQQKFNQDAKIAWLPDSFGFNWQLPQILVKSGFEAFTTQKLAWNDTNKPIDKVFWWQGLDGSKIFTYFPNEIGQDIEPESIAKHLADHERQHHIPETLWLYGVGDHGGGPTADMLDLGREWAESELFFTLIPGTIADYVLQLRANILQQQQTIPIWNDELYLELHRGVYTTKADQKLKHRRAELKLTNLEKYLAIAAILNPDCQSISDQTQAQLTTAWQSLLVNEFHDILPGSAIPEVFVDADLEWQEIDRIHDQLMADLSAKQPAKINDSSITLITLWNFLNWPRSAIVEIPRQMIAENITGSDLHNDQADESANANLPDLVPDLVAINPLTQQIYCTQATKEAYLVAIDNFPSLGNTQIQFKERSQFDNFNQSNQEPIVITSTHKQDSALSITSHSLENKKIKVEIDPHTGEISQIIDKRSGNKILRAPVQWQFFSDRGQYWDAWNIDPDYESKQLEAAELVDLKIKESGALRVSLAVIRKFRNSSIHQEIQLDADRNHVTVKNQLDWQEENTLVKVAFPVNWRSPLASYEIPMGAIERSTLAETERDRAKWEVPAQFWADLSGENIGLAVLNDCKYGYDAKPDQLRLTLLRSPVWCCPDSDRGSHTFTYRLVPHDRSWQTANVVQRGWELNNPIVTYPSINSLTSKNPSSLSNQNHFSLLQVHDQAGNNCANIVLTALKRSEDSKGWILRFYECNGQTTQAVIKFLPRIAQASECDLIERAIDNSDSKFCYDQNQISISFKPFEIMTLRVCFQAIP